MYNIDMLKSFYTRTMNLLVTHIHDVVLGLVWVAFGLIGSEAGIIQDLYTTSPPVAQVMEVEFVIIGLLMLLSVRFTSLTLPAYVFSTMVSLGALGVAVAAPVTSQLYPAVWIILALLSGVQVYKHYTARIDGD